MRLFRSTKENPYWLDDGGNEVAFHVIISTLRQQSNADKTGEHKRTLALICRERDKGRLVKLDSILTGSTWMHKALYSAPVSRVNHIFRVSYVTVCHKNCSRKDRRSRRNMYFYKGGRQSLPAAPVERGRFTPPSVVINCDLCSSSLIFEIYYLFLN